MRHSLKAILLIFCFSGVLLADSIRIATYNLKDYLPCDRKVENIFRKNYPKPENEKKALWKVIGHAKPTVIAVQEIGGQAYLEELQRDLKANGLSYPHMALFSDAKDPTRYTAVLSKIPIVKSRLHRFSFDYFGKKEHVRRGVLEVEFKTGDKSWLLFNLHLKSRISEDKRDPCAEYFRESEAKIIRDFIFKNYRGVPFVVVGDFNDAPNSTALRFFLKKGKEAFLSRIPAYDSRRESWTYHFRKEEGYSCSDYILASKLFPSIKGGEAHIVDIPEVKEASDHRLLFVEVDI